MDLVPYFAYGTTRQGFANHRRYADLLGERVARVRTASAHAVVVPHRAACSNPGCPYLHRMAALVSASSRSRRGRPVPDHRLGARGGRPPRDRLTRARGPVRARAARRRRARLRRDVRHPAAISPASAGAGGRSCSRATRRRWPRIRPTLRRPNAPRTAACGAPAMRRRTTSSIRSAGSPIRRQDRGRSRRPEVLLGMAARWTRDRMLDLCSLACTAGSIGTRSRATT